MDIFFLIDVCISCLLLDSLIDFFKHKHKFLGNYLMIYSLIWFLVFLFESALYCALRKFFFENIQISKKGKVLQISINSLTLHCTEGSLFTSTL